MEAGSSNQQVEKKRRRRKGSKSKARKFRLPSSSSSAGSNGSDVEDDRVAVTVSKAPNPKASSSSSLSSQPTSPSLPSLLDLSNRDLTLPEELLSETSKELLGEPRPGAAIAAWRKVRYLHLDGNGLTDLPRCEAGSKNTPWVCIRAIPIALVIHGTVAARMQK